MPAYPQVMTKPLPKGPAMTNLAGLPMPVAPTPLQAPNLPGSPAAPAFNYTPPTVGAAPTPTAVGAFVAPDPSQLANDKYYQFREGRMQRAIERGGAAHGTLLSGGFQEKLADDIGNFASAEGDKIYGRARDTYTTNRDTNALNFGQNLASYSAGTGAALDAGRLNLAGTTAGYDRAYGAGRDRFGDETAAATGQTSVINANSQAQDLYDQQMADYRAALERQQMDATAAPPPVRRPLPWMRTNMRG